MCSVSLLFRMASAPCIASKSKAMRGAEEKHNDWERLATTIGCVRMEESQAPKCWCLLQHCALWNETCDLEVEVRLQRV